MLGDIDTTGSLNAQIIHQLADRIRGKFVVQVGTLHVTFSLLVYQSFGPSCKVSPRDQFIQICIVIKMVNIAVQVLTQFFKQLWTAFFTQELYMAF